jgi:hypothetical protein
MHHFVVRTSRRLLVAIGALICAVALPQVAHAEIYPPLPIDHCANVAPNATRVLGPAVTSVVATSDTLYAVSPCFRYVVDINVPWNSSPAGKSPGDYWSAIALRAGEAGGQPPIPIAECSSYARYVTFYRRDGLQPTFERIGGGRLVGRITQLGQLSFCAVVKDSDYDDPPGVWPPTHLPTTYRIAVKASTTTDAANYRAVRAETAYTWGYVN